jgi:hypothetical protein
MAHDMPAVAQRGRPPSPCECDNAEASVDQTPHHFWSRHRFRKTYDNRGS